jgi:hypothetical protein
MKKKQKRQYLFIEKKKEKKPRDKGRENKRKKGFIVDDK